MPRHRPLLADNILELIGNTPLVRVQRLTRPGSAELLLKLESLNPSFSVKDRIAYAMLKQAQDEGTIHPGKTVIVEPTSGNTGIGLAMAAAVMGYRLILTMPDTMSMERRRVLQAMGAELVLTPEIRGMTAAIDKAEELVNRLPDAYMPQQFNNPANPRVHRLTTAQEILEATDGRLDAFVAGVGTGGTITGVGEILKQELGDVLIVAVEPAESPVLSGGEPGPHEIQGIGAWIRPVGPESQNHRRDRPRPFPGRPQGHPESGSQRGHLRGHLLRVQLLGRAPDRPKAGERRPGRHHGLRPGRALLEPPGLR